MFNWFVELFSSESDEFRPLIRFPSGTQITCPKCNREIAVAMRDIEMGESVRSDAWSSERSLEYGRMVCTDDDEPYAIPIAGGGLSLHTSKGWM